MNHHEQRKNQFSYNSKVTGNHEHHKTPKKKCQHCMDTLEIENNGSFRCPFCKHYTLHIPKNSIGKDNGAEIYCSICLIYWSRMDDSLC